ncbi:MAG: MerR family transcriptional regulator [Sneathiella sp.]|nr:MerR family transcriptional regulator [Sneathiella sp.]
MYICEISKKTGLTIKAIRLYEELGLIPKPKRSGTYRIYQQSDIEILLLIKEAKELGVTLSQLKALIYDSDGLLIWTKVAAFMIKKRQELQEEIKTLHSKIRKIENCLQQMQCTEKALDSAL